MARDDDPAGEMDEGEILQIILERLERPSTKKKVRRSGVFHHFIGVMAFIA